MALRMEKQILKQYKLLWMFVKRDLRTRYAGSVMGIFWSVIHPLLMLAIYVTVIGFFLGGGRYGSNPERGKEAFAIYLCCGLLPWTCVAEALLGAANCITANASLLKRAVFPIGILPAQSLVSAFLNFFITFGLFLTILLGFQIFAGTDYISGMLLYLPLAMFIQFVFLFGLCYMFATMQVFFRDTVQILNSLILIGFWITPIIYQTTILQSENLKENAPAWLLTGFSYWCIINPFAHLLALYQDIIYGTTHPNLWGIIYLLCLSILFYLAGKYLFTRSQQHFVDVV